MVFKVYFEKAFDSIRWDYLHDILKIFGFGDKWCGWINGCLNSAMGSVLVNGSPTSEFQFHKGLFSGIPIDSSLTLSRLFFVDDAIFIGKWDSLNIHTIVSVLKCFHLASSLKINFHKSKLMGIGTRSEEVDATATTIGCSIFTTPFLHFGVKVGGAMSKVKSWDDIVAKVSFRLSKFPSGVLKLLEFRRNLFNGVDGSKRKMAWISWNKVLAFKKYGGLDVSTIYGEDGALNSPSSLSKRSPWLNIIREVTVLRIKGINLLDFIRKKVSNELNTLFWEDPWLDDLALKHKFPRLYALDNYKQITVVKKINHASMVDTFRRPPRGGDEEEQLATCEFSVKSVRQLIDDSILPKEEVATRWVKVMPLKINVFAWRVRLDKLPTRLNLSLKCINISTIVCPLCHASVESGSHIFFSCPMARHLWRKLMRWWELEDIDLVSYDDWLL
ncbi:RNA-directed DNA polymerase, eukaryota, reverse transcriptase zinc-binding domain protein [Tanacetum coccineum]